MVPDRIGTELHIQVLGAVADLHSTLSRIPGLKIGGLGEEQRLAAWDDGIRARENLLRTRIKNIGSGEVAAHCGQTTTLPAHLIVGTDGEIRTQLDLAGKLLNRSNQLFELGVGHREQLDDVHRRLRCGNTVVTEKQALAIQHRVLAGTHGDRHIRDFATAKYEGIQQLSLAPMQLLRITGKVVILTRATVDRVRRVIIV
ncbi:hypothetical protein D3C75_672910 [compost metagenome]